MDSNKKEQTTLRLPAELVIKLEKIAEKENISVSTLILRAARKIVKRYKFDERLKLIV